jgi:hypothetical protein
MIWDCRMDHNQKEAGVNGTAMIPLVYGEVIVTPPT